MNKFKNACMMQMQCEILIPKLFSKRIIFIDSKDLITLDGHFKAEFDLYSDPKFDPKELYGLSGLIVDQNVSFPLIIFFDLTITLLNCLIQCLIELLLSYVLLPF